jgi:transposase-like protein
VKLDLKSDEEEVGLITTLPPKQQRFVHLYLTGQYPTNKLAQLLEVHPNTIFNWMKNPTVNQVILEMQESTTQVVQTQLKALTLKAVNKLNELVNSPIDGVALQAVKDILDRSGHKAKQEIKVEKTVTFEEKMKNLIDITPLDEVMDDE